MFEQKTQMMLCNAGWQMSTGVLSGMALFLLVSLMLMLKPLRAEELTDPMRPSNVTERVSMVSSGTEGAWNLTSTLVSGERRLATINGQLVTVGDWVAGAKVQSIDSNGVRLIQAGKMLNVPLQVYSLRKPVAVDEH